MAPLRASPFSFGRIIVALALGLAGLAPGTAYAQELSVPPTSPPEVGAAADAGAATPYWSSGKTRPFFGMVWDFSGLSSRIEADIGYGKPHHAWVGLEVASALSLRGATVIAGVKGVMPWGSARLVARNFHGMRQYLIPEGEVITKVELEVSENVPRSAYGAIDGEVSVDIPLPVGTLGVLVGAHGLFVPYSDGYFVLEDSLRVIMDPPFVWRARLRYLASIGVPATLRIGGLVEAIHNPGRETLTLRTGPAVAVSLTHHMDAVAAAAFTFYAPDDIGFAGADLGQISLRYRWATGDVWPDFP